MDIGVCKGCRDDKYILQGCCSGRDCGCMGQPVSMTNCKICNPDGSAELPNDENFRFYAEHVEYVGDKLDRCKRR